MFKKMSGLNDKSKLKPVIIVGNRKWEFPDMKSRNNYLKELSFEFTKIICNMIRFEKYFHIEGISFE